MTRAITIRKTNNPKILGLDCSSSTVGWGLIALDEVPELVAYGHIKPLGPNYVDMERLDDIYCRINELCNELDPSYVAVEDIFLFVKGQSTARTITILAAFNRVISLATYQKTKNVSFYLVHDIRRIISNQYDIKIDKEGMPDAINSYLSADFDLMINKKGNIKKETYDEADGIAVAWAHYLCIKHPEIWQEIQDTRDRKKLRRKGKKGKKE